MAYTARTGAGSPVGGGNLAVFFALGTNAFGTEQTHGEDRTKSTKVVGHPTKKSVVIDLDASHADDTFNTFVNTYLYEGEVNAIVEKYEDSSQVSNTVVSSAKQFGYIMYFGSNNGKRKVLMGVGVLSGATGDSTTAVDGYEQTPVQITAVAAPATYTIGTALFNTSKVTAATITLASGSYGSYSFMTAV